MNDLKIFKFEGDETDWYADTDLESAKKHYISHIGGHEFDLEGVEITEVLKSEWRDNYIVDPEELKPAEGEEGFEGYSEDDYCNGRKIIDTFEGIMKTLKSHDLIASTCY